MDALSSGKPDINWTEIERKFRAGTTVRAIAAEHGISHQAISKRAKAKNWHRPLVHGEADSAVNAPDPDDTPEARARAEARLAELKDRFDHGLPLFEEDERVAVRLNIPEDFRPDLKDHEREEQFKDAIDVTVDGLGTEMAVFANTYGRIVLRIAPRGFPHDGDTIIEIDLAEVHEVTTRMRKLAREIALSVYNELKED